MREVKEEQDDIKRFLTFSDAEEEETETKRKDSNFVTFARRMSCMVLGEKGRTSHPEMNLNIIFFSLFRSETKEEKSSFSKPRAKIRAEEESQVFRFRPQAETGPNYRLPHCQEKEILFLKLLGFGQETLKSFLASIIYIFQV